MIGCRDTAPAAGAKHTKGSRDDAVPVPAHAQLAGKCGMRMARGRDGGASAPRSAFRDPHFTQSVTAPLLAVATWLAYFARTPRV